MIPSPVISDTAQLSQWVQSVNTLINLGAVGVLLLLGFALVLWIWTSRNKKSTTEDSAKVITMLSSIVAKQDERQEKSEEANRKLLQDFKEQQTESMTAVSDGLNKQADNYALSLRILNDINSHNQQQTIINTVVREDLKQMTERGSVPLQNLIITVARIETSILEIKNNLIPCAEVKSMVEEDRQLFRDALEALNNDVQIFKLSMQARIDEKRKSDTAELSAITPPVVTPEVG